MPELIEQMYCSQQIVIPPKFPYILKRYCKAAIKTQPYDLLRWSFEYFKALAQRRPPPVKLRLEYPVYSTEGGLTRGCLKVLANQLDGMKDIPLPVAKAAWQGFCLDPEELIRIFCLCEVHKRADSVPFLHFIAVAGGLLTKSLTHTMILLCETLTKEPDGGSAAIPVRDFLTMYRFLAPMDASCRVRYLNGYREGFEPEEEEEAEEEQSTVPSTPEEASIDDFWAEKTTNLHRLSLLDDNVPATAPHISSNLNKPIIGTLERSPSVERAAAQDREEHAKYRTVRASSDKDTELKLKELSMQKMLESQTGLPPTTSVESKKDEVPADEENIHVINEDGQVVPYEIYGEPKLEPKQSEHEQEDEPKYPEEPGEAEPEAEPEPTEAENIQAYVEAAYKDREIRRQDLEETFEEIQALVDRYKTAFFDLGNVAGRQMSTTSGEFIVRCIEREIMDYIDEQIGILPDPDLKKKKAKPEEVAMIRDMLEEFLDENMCHIVKETEAVEEEEETIPEIIVVFAVPGIGPPVDQEIMREFEDYALEACTVQAEVFMPRNIRHFMCPPLEKYMDHHYDDDTGVKERRKSEEVPTGGQLTN